MRLDVIWFAPMCEVRIFDGEIFEDVTACDANFWVVQNPSMHFWVEI